MPSVIDPHPSPTRPRSRAKAHWVWIAVVSIVIHLLLLDALPHFAVEPAVDETALEPLTARLMPPIEPAATPASQPAPEPAVEPMRVPTRTPRPTPRPSVPTTTEPFVSTSLQSVPEVQAPTATSSPPKSTSSAIASTPAAIAPVPAPPAATPSQVEPATVRPPLSARLEYKALSQKVNEANPIYGNGTITWSTADGRYGIDLEVSAKVLFANIGLLASHSEGSIGASGLVPDRYTEKTVRRSVLATNFNRDDRQTVTFSASTVSVPLVPGTQDRLSIMFQIGGLLLADPSKGAADSRIEVPVANVRDEIERWVFTCLGTESIETGVGPSMTTHLQRTPKPDSKDKTIDLWVADGGYPARVLYTEPNGNTIMMTLDRIGTVP